MIHLLTQGAIYPMRISFVFVVRCFYFCQKSGTYRDNFYHFIYVYYQIQNTNMQSPKGGSSTSGQSLIHPTTLLQQDYNKNSLYRNQLLYQKLQGYFQADLDQQKKYLRNCQLQQGNLRRIKQQLLDNLKGLDQLESNYQQSKKQFVNKDVGDIEVQGINNFITFKKIDIESNHHQKNGQYQDRIIEDRVQQFKQQFELLKIEVEHLRRLYFEMDQMLVINTFQQKAQNHQDHVGSSKDVTSAYAESLIVKLQKLMKENDRLNTINKQLRDNSQNIMKIQNRQKSIIKGNVDNDKKNNQDKAKSDEYENEKSVIRLESELKIKGIYLEQIKKQLMQTQYKLRRKELKVLELQTQLKQFKEIKEEYSILKMKVFGMQNLHQSHQKAKIHFVIRDANLIHSQILSSKIAQNRQKDDILTFKSSLQRVSQKKNVGTIKQSDNKKYLLSQIQGYKKKNNDLQAIVKELQLNQSLMSQKFVKRLEEYDIFIKKLQKQLQKAILFNNQKQQKQNIELITAPYSQKIQMLITQNSFIKHQLAYQHSILGHEQEERKKQKQISEHQILRLQKINHELLNENRNSKKMILEQQLDQASSRIKNTHMQNPTSQLFSLNQQITILKSKIEQKNAFLNKQKAKNQRLFKLTSTQASQLQENKIQIQQLRQKVQIQSKNKSEEQMSRVIGSQDFKKELQLQRKYREQAYKKIAFFDEQKRGYQLRVWELQQILQQMAIKEEEKDNQIQKIKKQKQLLIEKVTKFQNQFEELKGKTSSLKEMDFISHSNELQSDLQQMKRQLSSFYKKIQGKDRELQNLRQECDNLWEDNLKLILTLKQNNIDFKERDELIESYQQQKKHKLRQMENKVMDLTHDNTVLKNLVDDLKTKLAEKSNILASSALRNLQNQVQYYKKQIQALEAERNRLAFKKQNKFLQKEEEFQKKLAKSYHQGNLQRKQLIKYQEIQSYKDELAKRDAIIERMKKMLGGVQGLNKLNSSDILTDKNHQQQGYYFISELIDLRKELQECKQAKFVIQNRLRQLEQQNSQLKVKLISTDQYENESKDSVIPFENIKDEKKVPTKQLNLNQNLFEYENTPEYQFLDVPNQQKQKDNFKQLAQRVPLVQSVRGYQEP